jgi:hypothetical protein
MYGRRTSISVLLLPAREARFKNWHLSFRRCIDQCVRWGAGLRYRSGEGQHRALAHLVHRRGRADLLAGGAGVIYHSGQSGEGLLLERERSGYRDRALSSSTWGQGDDRSAVEAGVGSFA